MKIYQVKIGKKDVPLRFDLMAYELIDERFGSFADMVGDLKVGSQREQMNAIVDVIAILANAAFIADEREDRMDPRYLKSHITPGKLMPLSDLLTMVFNEGMRSDVEDSGLDDEVHDVVLEELAKKAQAEASSQQNSISLLSKVE